MAINVFLTGASSGIGAALAAEFARRGATLGLVARRPDALDAVLAQVPGRHHRYAVDVTDKDALIAAAPDLLGVGERLPVTANMMISNPYGIPNALYLNGSRLDYFVPFVGPSLGTRLLVGIYTYAGETFVAITSLRSVVPTVERLSELVQVSFAELEQAAGVAQQPAAKRAAVAGQRAVRRSKAARASV